MFRTGNHLQRGAQCVAASCLLGMSGLGPAQATTQIVEENLSAVPSSERDTEIGVQRGSFLVVPIPFSNPVIGTGLALGGGYLFELAPGAKTSFVGVGALKSDNGSQAYGIAGDLSFGSGWSFNLLAGEAALRYDLVVDGLDFPVNQDAAILRAGAKYNFTQASAFGLNLRYLDSQISLRDGGDLTGDLLDDSDLELGSLGLSYEWDLRDDSDYPTDGYLLSAAVNRGFSLRNDSRNYDYGSINFDAYRTVGEERVVAGRVSTCAATDNAPFFDQCALGLTDAFRGFSPTEFYDTRLVSTQAEYRQRIGSRFGFVVFGGIGWIGDSYSTLTDRGEFIAGGVGGRYRVSKEFPIDLSVDVTTNNEDEEILYIFVGQRF